MKRLKIENGRQQIGTLDHSPLLEQVRCDKVNLFFDHCNGPAIGIVPRSKLTPPDQFQNGIDTWISIVEIL